MQHQDSKDFGLVGGLSRTMKLLIAGEKTTLNALIHVFITTKLSADRQCSGQCQSVLNYQSGAYSYLSQIC